jgi:small GTP-binding protein
MGKNYKVVITGTFNAGKTTFVDTLSDIDIVNTDKVTSTAAEQGVKAATTTALDYGNVKLAEDTRVHLMGTPGQTRFDFMQDILTKVMDGFVFLVDATDPGRLDEAGRLLWDFREFNMPYLVAVNKTDLHGLSLDEVRVQLNLPDQQRMVACVATNSQSTRQVIQKLVDLIEKQTA